jgi:hypothetical protein
VGVGPGVSVSLAVISSVAVALVDPGKSPVYPNDDNDACSRDWLDESDEYEASSELISVKLLISTFVSLPLPLSPPCSLQYAMKPLMSALVMSVAVLAVEFEEDELTTRSIHCLH